MTDENTPKGIVRRWWMAMGRGDFDTAGSLLADDMVWEVMGLDDLAVSGAARRSS